jgi:hypothetical protein
LKVRSPVILAPSSISGGHSNGDSVDREPRR